MNNAQERFRHIHLQEEYDCATAFPISEKRSEISEILAAHNIVFVLTKSGICIAYNRETNQILCVLNVGPDEVIRSMSYNKSNDSLITVSVYAADNFCSMKCRTISIEYIQLGKPDEGSPLFESENLVWPSFVEFDDENRKVITYSAQDSVYKVFDMKDYTMLYSISDKNVKDLKLSPGSMLLMYTKANDHVPLKILSIEDGSIIKSFNHPLQRNKNVDFVELFNDKLLIKQENENLEILDVNTSELVEVSKTQFITPSAFIFLHQKHLFLTFRNLTVSVWNSYGELINSFENNYLWNLNSSNNHIYITSDQDLLISYCKAGSDDPLSQGNVGSVNISDVLTGKCIAKIEGCKSIPLQNSRIRSSEVEALEDITAIFYDEERNEIYTGNKLGLVHVWCNSHKSML